MDRTVFDFQEYKEYLKAAISSRPRNGRGFRSHIAAAMRCQMTYLSRVLNGNAHLSLEQAEKVNSLLGHSTEEADFFLLLVQLNRAGSAELRDRFRRHVREVLQKRLNLRNRLAYKQGLNREDQSIYYSSWHYAAIHMLLTIPQFQSKEVLSKRTGLSPDVVANILEFLISVGLAQIEDNRYKTGPTQIYLENDSPMISKHHINWRMQAIRSIDRARAEDLHYSSVVAISYDDSLRIRDILVKAIEQIRPVIKTSKEEALFSYGIDLFEVR